MRKKAPEKLARDPEVSLAGKTGGKRKPKILHDPREPSQNYWLESVPAVVKN